MLPRLAGAPGFEPGNGGTKNRCLTAWLRPSRPSGQAMPHAYIYGHRPAQCTPARPQPHRNHLSKPYFIISCSRVNIRP